MQHPFASCKVVCLLEQTPLLPGGGLAVLVLTWNDLLGSSASWFLLSCGCCFAGSISLQVSVHQGNLGRTLGTEVACLSSPSKHTGRTEKSPPPLPGPFRALSSLMPPHQPSKRSRHAVSRLC